MKRNRFLSLTAFSIICLFVLQSNGGGYFTTMVANDPNAGCNCHGASVQSSNDALKIEVLDGNNNSVSSYLPNTNYTVRLILKKNFANSAAGFQAAILNSGTSVQAGTPTAGSLSQIKNIGGTSVILHNQKDVSSLKVGSDVTWEFPWKSPLIANNNVTVYAIANDANNNGMASGDAIVHNDLFLSNIPNAVQDYSKGIEAIYPNPTTESITVSLTSTRASNVSIYSITGQLVKQITAEGNKVKLNVSDLTNGNYIIAIAQDGNFARQQFVKY